MYINTAHAREVSFATLIKALIYAILPPQQGYINKLRLRFGSSALLYLNTETFLADFLMLHPDRVPGMAVAIESRYVKRFQKVIKRAGLKPLAYSGQKQLALSLEHPRLLCVFIPEAYDVSQSRYLKAYQNSTVSKVVYQNRKKPRSVALDHDVFIWEPRQLPRAMSGSVVVCNYQAHTKLFEELKHYLNQRLRIKNNRLVKEIYQAVFWNQEDRFRRVDSRPPRILARLMYDLYK